MDKETIILAGLAVFLLSAVGFAQTPPLSQKAFEATEVQTNVAVNEEFLAGKWIVIGMSIADPGLQGQFNATPDLKTDGLKNPDGSIKNMLEIKRAPTKPEAAAAVDPDMNITLYSYLSKEKKSVIGPRVLQWSSLKRILTFKRDIMNPDTGKPCGSYFEFTCRHVWPDRADGLRMLCAVRFKKMIDPETGEEERFNETLMKFANKPDVAAYYLFKKISEVTPDEQQERK